MTGPDGLTGCVSATVLDVNVALSVIPVVWSAPTADTDPADADPADARAAHANPPDARAAHPAPGRRERIFPGE